MLPVPLQNDACWCEVRSWMHSHEAALETLITDYTERERQGILCDMNFAWLVQVRSQTKPRELFFLITAPCISYIPWSDQPAGGLPQRCDKWLKHPGKTTDDASRRLTNIKAFWEPPHQKNVVVVVDPKASAHLLGNQIFCQIGAKHSQKNEIKNIWCFFWNPAQGRIGWPGGPASARELPVDNHQVYRQHTRFKVHVGSRAKADPNCSR